MKLKYYLFVCLSLLGFASCSEEDDTVQEFDNWQVKNETYFEEQYQQHMTASSATCFVLKNYSKGDTLQLSQVPHTDCILVDVLPSDFPVEGDLTVTPIFSDDVAVHYIGNILPSPSYATGYPTGSRSTCPRPCSCAGATRRLGYPCTTSLAGCSAAGSRTGDRPRCSRTRTRSRSVPRESCRRASLPRSSRRPCR